MGVQTGKFVCTTGKLPLSWSALASTFGYGFKSYAKYPNGMVHFYQECLPEGLIQDRTIDFEGEGTLKTHAEIYYENGVLVNNVTVECEGFSDDSPVLNNGIGHFLPTTEMDIAVENGIKGISTMLYPLKDQSKKMFITAQQSTIYKPRCEGQVVPLPRHHFTHVHLKQFSDTDETRDHILQHEALEAFDFNLIGTSLSSTALNQRGIQF